jgi:hypothetical protein
MHLILEKNHQLVQRIAAWLAQMELPTAWAVPLVQEFEKGESLRLAKAIEEQLALSKENRDAEHRGVDGLGQVTSQVASSLRMEIVRRMGPQAMEDKKLLRRIEQDYGLQFKPNYQRKARVVMGSKTWSPAA